VVRLPVLQIGLPLSTASPVNAAITWSVTAVDPILTKNTVGTGYQDEPLFGTTASASY
jgi:hypothetical protein